LLYDLLVDGAGLRIFDAGDHGPFGRDEFDEVFEQPISNFVAHTRPDRCLTSLALDLPS
jgi:hypothetical protein